MSTVMQIDELMTLYKDGGELGWEYEFNWMRSEHSAKVSELTLSVLQNGIREPLLIGDDGRLWDGHHRLYVAYFLGFTHVPVKYARDDT